MRPSIDFIKNKFGNRKIIGAEIGVASGIHSKQIYSELNFEKLMLIDIWENIKSNIPYGGNFEQYYLDVKKIFADKNNVCVIKSDSKKASANFEDNFFDFIYIDASHEYEDVKSDLELWYPKVKIEGVFCGHDYEATDPKSDGVDRAVKEFCLGKNLKLNCLKLENKTYLNSDWWIIK